MADTPTMAETFKAQAKDCAANGSDFTARLLTLASAWMAEDNPIAARLSAWPAYGKLDAVPLRFTGAVHALALSGKLPAMAAELDKLQSSGKLDADHLWPEITAAIEQNSQFVDRFLDSPPQTNEVGRSAVLMASAQEISRKIDLPIHLLEAGASAGLNLNFARYNYHLGEGKFGDQTSTLTLAPKWSGPTPPHTVVNVASHQSCDASPLDLADRDEVLRLRSYIWADQSARATRLTAAIEIAKTHPVSVSRATIGNWLEDVLKAPRQGQLTMLYHTIVWQYLPAYEVALAEARIREAGDRATKTAPFARVAMEWVPAISAADVKLTLWPGGTTHLLGHAHAHGQWIEWKGLGET